jgi:hypothetical protein
MENRVEVNGRAYQVKDGHLVDRRETTQDGIMLNIHDRITLQLKRMLADYEVLSDSVLIKQGYVTEDGKNLTPEGRLLADVLLARDEGEA